MAEIVSIKDRTPVTQKVEPDAELIERIEKLLVEAKAGKVMALMWAAVRPAEILAHGYVGAASRHLMVAATTYLKNMVVEMACGDDDDDGK